MAVRAKDIMAIMEEAFPLYLAESWDNSGLQIGSADKEVSRLLIALDLDEFALQQAMDERADMIITHHPFFFRPLKNIDYTSPEGTMIQKAVMAGITIYAAHTNLDSARQGLNQALAERLGLLDIEPLYPAYQEALFKLAVFVPATHEEAVREAICAAGGGFTGRYSDCSFRTRGIGTFRPGPDTNPYIGKSGVLEEADEFRLETIIYEHDISRVLTAMRKAHPYEEAAYDLYRLENQGREFSPGRKGHLPRPASLRDYILQVKAGLGLKSLRVVGDPDRMVSNVAVISGAGAGLIGHIRGRDIDVLVTGDLKYHEAKAAEASGLAVIDAGHQGTEAIVVPLLYDFLADKQLAVELIQCHAPACIKDV